MLAAARYTHSAQMLSCSASAYSLGLLPRGLPCHKPLPAIDQRLAVVNAFTRYRRPRSMLSLRFRLGLPRALSTHFCRSHCCCAIGCPIQRGPPAAFAAPECCLPARQMPLRRDDDATAIAIEACRQVTALVIAS